MSWIQSTIHKLYSVVTRIRFPEDPGHATGFFYNNGGNTYLITNQHVLKQGSNTDQNSAYEPIYSDNSSVYDSIRIFIRDMGALENTNPIDISLENGRGTDYLLHPELPAIDMVAIPLDFELSLVSDNEQLLTGSLALNEQFLPRHTPLDFEGLFAPTTLTMGYPGNFQEENADLPICRDSKIASPYDYAVNDAPYFVIDARMMDGTSGSPVFFDPMTTDHLARHQNIRQEFKIPLLGVHSASLQQTNAPFHEIRTDLNIVWYIQLLPEILSGESELFDN